MRRFAVIAVALLATGAGLFWIAFQSQEDEGVPGYMEADLVLVGSEQGGRISTLAVQEGDAVSAGDLIFELESSEERADVAEAKARLVEAEARLADVEAEQQRPREIEVLSAALTRAKAMARQSALNLDRVRQLHGKGWVAEALLDEAMAEDESNQAAVAEAERRIAAARLPGRSGVIRAAKASVEAARHALVEAQRSLAKREVFTPVGGTIEEVYFRPGEVVTTGQSVVALLPPENLKVRFFVGEPDLAKLKLEQTVALSCDSCPADLRAKVSFIAREAEFTPPVIFSREQRQKLVFLVEARPDPAAAALTAGQPVTVKIAPDDQEAM
ncbi:MAG: HlyD family efflux transporter periplasmic adaptor subunit [Methyloceanibacter sp.]|nr:HlyD family efflux transporter periplasmic adaptor subunit [Methyloceanibacter sp.]